MPDLETPYVLSKQDADPQAFLAFERLLGETIKPFMAEVYMINAGTLASYIYSHREGNLGDIVESSAEALHRPELLRYARCAAVDFDWNSPLAITIRLEFVHETLTTLFDLVMNADSIGIDILDISFREEFLGTEDSYERFAQAMCAFRRLDA